VEHGREDDEEDKQAEETYIDETTIMQKQSNRRNESDNTILRECQWSRSTEIILISILWRVVKTIAKGVC
jgi:hypothetical protein